jgi:MFS family permease
MKNEVPESESDEMYCCNTKVDTSAASLIPKVDSENVSPESTNNDNIVPMLDDPDRFPEGGRVAYTVLAGSFLGLTGVLSFVNSLGVFENYISTHIFPTTAISSVGWIFSIYNFFAFGGTLISGPIFDKIGCRLPIAVGTVLMTIGFMTMSVSTELWHFILSYSVCGGIGTALTFGPFVGVLSHYFLRKRGRAIGVAYIGGAIGGVAFPTMFRSLFPKIGFGWSIRVGSFICLALLLIGLALVKDRHVEFQKNVPSSNENIAKQIVKSIDFTVFKSKVYSCLVLALLGNGFAFLITSTYLPSYATTFGYSEANSYLLVTVFNCLSIPGRLIPAWFADKYGRFNSLCIISTMSTLVFFIIWVNRPVGHSLGGLFAFAACFGFSSGSVLSLTPAVIGQIFRVEDIGKSIGTAFFVLSFGDLVGIPIGGAITSSRTKDSFDWLVVFMALCSFFGTVGSYCARYLYAGINLKRV